MLDNQNGSASGGRPVALVTGSSSGFGMLGAIRLAESGFYVVASMRQPDRQGELMELARSRQVAETIEVCPLDVTDPASVEAAVQRVLDARGRIDVLVNNAGYAQGGFTEDVDLAAWRAQFETNVFGAIAVTKAVLPHMRERRRGTIINISSVNGRMAFPGFGPYAASKFALEGFSETLRLEMKPYGVHVALVEPGAYPTNIWDKGFGLAKGDENSPYYPYLQKVLGFARQSAASKADPLEVADLIARIATAPQPKFRWPIGQGSRMLFAAKSLLPWSWLERIILRALRF